MTKEDAKEQFIKMCVEYYDRGFDDACQVINESLVELGKVTGKSAFTIKEIMDLIEAGRKLLKDKKVTV